MALDTLARSDPTDRQVRYKPTVIHWGNSVNSMSMYLNLGHMNQTSNPMGLNLWMILPGHTATSNIPRVRGVACVITLFGIFWV